MLCALLALAACSKPADSASQANQDASKTAKSSDDISKTMSDTLVIYTSRNEQLVQPLFDAYSKATGTRIDFVTDKAEPLIQKLKAEGEHTPADLLITVDAGNLSRAANEDLLLALPNGALSLAIPEHLRDPKDQWFGVSQRARTIVYSPERVKDGELITYEDLASAKWKGRLCLRTSKKVYNQSLVAMLIAKHGEPLKVFWPNQNATDGELSGVHVNVSGVALLKHAKHYARAIDFIEWMVKPEAQKILAHGNMEYSVTSKIEQHPIVADWGKFTSDTQSIAKAGEFQPAAVRLMDRAGYL